MIDDRTLIRVGRLLAGASVAAALISMGILAMLGQWGIFIEGFVIHNALLAIGFGSLAWVTLATQARNGAVWALAWAAFFGALFTAGVAIVFFWGKASIPEFSLEVLDALTPSDFPLAIALALQPVTWAYIPAFMLVLTLGLLLFPDGRPPSPRWRWVGWYSVATIAAAVAPWVWLVRPSSTVPLSSAAQPEAGTAGQLAEVFLLLALLGAVLSVAALVVRYRRSSGVTRHQIRWIAWGGIFLVTTLMVSSLVEGATSEAGTVSGYLTLAGEALLILSFWVAITKYRLYDIDLVISRTVTYGALALFITAVYVGIVVGIGSLVGQGDEPNLALAIAATATVALLFQPIRSRLQRWANRLVYGERATPYSVLSELSSRFSGAESNDQALQRLSELLASGTGAAEAVVWLRVGDRLRPEAIIGDSRLSTVTVEDGVEPTIPGDDSEPIYHSGELLGALSISKERGHPVTPADRQLLEDVAAGAGLLLRNIQLNADLADRAEELRMSRRRLVAAQDAERRRLERNLHDGAQQQVVALKVKLGLAKTLAEREDADQIAIAVADLADDTQRAVDGMRAAARGIYPPLLEAEGIRAALTAAGREAGINVAVDAQSVGRYSPEVEATVYFSVLEAMADGSRVTVAEDGGQLSFTIEAATGASSHPTVADRMEALGGTLSATTSSSSETTVIGRLPVTALEPL